eukprot:jgi/Botrbrau1/12463/Bobra.0169s0011.1
MDRDRISFRYREICGTKLNAPRNDFQNESDTLRLSIGPETSGTYFRSESVWKPLSQEITNRKRIVHATGRVWARFRIERTAITEAIRVRKRDESSTDAPPISLFLKQKQKGPSTTGVKTVPVVSSRCFCITNLLEEVKIGLQTMNEFQSDSENAEAADSTASAPARIVAAPVPAPAATTPHQSKSSTSARHTTTFDQIEPAGSSHASSLSTAAVLFEKIVFPDTSRYRLPEVDWYNENEFRVHDKVIANTTDWEIVHYYLRSTYIDELDVWNSYVHSRRFVLEWLSALPGTGGQKAEDLQFEGFEVLKRLKFRNKRVAKDAFFACYQSYVNTMTTVQRVPEQRPNTNCVWQNAPVVAALTTGWLTPNGAIEGSEQLFMLFWGEDGLMWQEFATRQPLYQPAGYQNIQRWLFRTVEGAIGTFEASLEFEKREVYERAKLQHEAPGRWMIILGELEKKQIQLLLVLLLVEQRAGGGDEEGEGGEGEDEEGGREGERGEGEGEEEDQKRRPGPSAGDQGQRTLSYNELARSTTSEIHGETAALCQRPLSGAQAPGAGGGRRGHVGSPVVADVKGSIDSVPPSTMPEVTAIEGSTDLVPAIPMPLVTDVEGSTDLVPPSTMPLVTDVDGSTDLVPPSAMPQTAVSAPQTESSCGFLEDTRDDNAPETSGQGPSGERAPGQTAIGPAGAVDPVAGAPVTGAVDPVAGAPVTRTPVGQAAGPGSEAGSARRRRNVPLTVLSLVWWLCPCYWIYKIINWLCPCYWIHKIITWLCPCLFGNNISLLPPSFF